MKQYKKFSRITILSLTLIVSMATRSYGSSILDFQLDETISEDIDMSIFEEIEELEETKDRLEIKKGYYNNIKALNPTVFENDINRKFCSRDGSKVLGYNKRTKKHESVDIENALKAAKNKSYLPLEENYMMISSRYGFRKDPFNLKIADQGGIDLDDLNSVNTGFHSGLDLAASGINGARIYNFLEGKIKKIERSNSGYGNLVVVDSGSFESYYAHLSQIEAGLKEGDHVKTGQILGRVGSTGRSTGPHLHMEVIVGDIAINPQIILDDAIKNSRYIKAKPGEKLESSEKKSQEEEVLKPVLFKIEDFLIEAKSK